MPDIDTLQVICPLFINLHSKHFARIVRDRKELNF